ncbi:hypothetical protein ACROYT_G035608 [Oculina patagonica]
MMKTFPSDAKIAATIYQRGLCISGRGSTEQSIADYKNEIIQVVHDALKGNERKKRKTKCVRTFAFSNPIENELKQPFTEDTNFSKPYKPYKTYKSNRTSLSHKLYRSNRTSCYLLYISSYKYKGQVEYK